MALRDIVTMPLPTQWGPTVLPLGWSPTPPPVPASAAAAPVPAGAVPGWGRVPSGGWIFGHQHRNGRFVPAPGATVVATPGAIPAPGLGPADVQNYMAGTVGDNPDQPSNQYPGSYAGGSLVNSQPTQQNPVPGLMLNPGAVSTGAPLTGPNPPSTPGTPWARQQYPDPSTLPYALQTQYPLNVISKPLPNSWDAQLRRQLDNWSYIRSHGGLRSVCRIPQLGAPIYASAPWISMPNNAEPLNQMFSQPPSAFYISPSNPIYSGVDVAIGQVVVPNGWDGIINRVIFGFTGNGFVDFSGNIVWRVKVGNRFARNLGAVINTYGDFATAFQVPGTDVIRLVSQQTITLIGNIPTGSPVADGVVTAGVFGWFWPRR
jgi:hypothetical protein